MSTSERIEVENFGPVKEAKINLNKLIVLVGPQAGGKSTLAKLIYFSRLMKKLLAKLYFEEINRIVIRKVKAELVDAETIKANFKHNLKEKLDKIFGGEYLNSNFKLRYFVDDDNCFELFNAPYGIELNVSSNFISLIEDVNSFIDDLKGDNSKFKETLSSQYDVSKSQDYIGYIISSNAKIIVENKIASYFQSNRDALYVPAGRAAFSLISDQLSSINYANIDELYKKFVDKFKTVLQNFSHKDYLENIPPWLINLEEVRATLFDSFKIADVILRGTYVYSDGEPKIRLKEGEEIRLSFASSGQQEAVSIILICLELISTGNDNFIVVEEPEAHLFPNSQFEVVKLIANLLNISNVDNNVVITTHSPYILSSINCLLLAADDVFENVENDFEDEENKKVADKELVLPSRYWFNSRFCSAYTVDGEATSIIDDELGIIKIEYIDFVSSYINDIQNRLMDINYRG